jgi:SNF2 family DNA or RNA helicase
MDKIHVDFYNGLTETEKYIINIATIYAENISPSALQGISKKSLKLTQKEIGKVLEKASNIGLLTKSYRDYSIAVPMIIYLYPKLKDYHEEWAKGMRFENHYYSWNITSQNFSSYIYALLYKKENIKKHERKLLENERNNELNVLMDILDNSDYQEVMHLMDFDLIHRLLRRKVDTMVNNLEPLSKLSEMMEWINHKFPKNTTYSSTLKAIIGHHSGSIEGMANNEKINESVKIFVTATTHFLKGDLKTSLVTFDKGMKLQRSNISGYSLPISTIDAFYYLTLLSSLSPEVSAPIFAKILKSLEKKSHGPFDFGFKAVLYYALNDKKSLTSECSYLYHVIESNLTNYYALNGILVYALIDRKPDSKLFDTMFEVAKKAYTNGYKILAYEAAYALKSWKSDKETEAFFEEIKGGFDCPPALSHPVRQNEWEKAINSLLTIASNKTSANSKDGSKYRVVYYVNMKRINIQPVLQTKNAKGVWSAGRNIAMKTFQQGTPEGMTEQDYRVSKKVKHSNSYYSDEYFFSEDAIVELIGHPYVFVEGSADVPIELIAAQPIIKVEKTKNGYALKTDITNTSEKIIITKETNTRYKVYNLTGIQQTIIEAIKLQNVNVPEQGKEKLMQVIGNFSTHFAVHSDLLATESSNIKKVEADSRIRVQLLPLGDGLKAELFAKPFGNHPPYCKPGKGGKTLIANEKGEQLQVTRNIDQELDNENALLQQLQSLECIDMSDDLISFEDPRDSLHLLDILGAYQEICVVEWPEGERFKIRGSAGISNLNIRVKSKTNWFELDGELTVDENTVVTIQQLLEITAKGHHKFVELKKGEFIALSKRLKKQLDELRAFSNVSKQGVQLNKFASVALSDFFDEAENIKADKSWKQFRERVRLENKKEVQIPTNLQAELRPYQEEGFRWLSRLAEWEGGACLADDMGLGKTIQTLALLLHRASSGAALVVCPLSVINNWISEINKFAPTLNVKILTSGNRAQIIGSLDSNDVLIVSYGILQTEEKALSQVFFSTIVLDEAHTIKNFTTKTSKAAMQLQASFKMVLTGTPIQNHLGEIWNLFNFINPGLLGTLAHFTDHYIKTEDKTSQKHLKKLIAPFILRRTKSAVLDELPPKTEIVKKVELSGEEMAFYEALRRKAIENLENDDSNQGAKHLKALAEITRLRQACCNPALVDPIINIESSKLNLFLEIVTEFIENKHRALVFSQFVTHLTIVRKALDEKGIKYQYLDGSCSAADREKSVKSFQNGESDLFLISLKAGGLGLNLTAADYVIHMDPWWNPAVEDQASDRTHRFGQTRPVTIYRLVAQNTIEEKIIQLHNTKRDLAESLLEGSDQSAKLSITELISLIKERD